MTEKPDSQLSQHESSETIKAQVRRELSKNPTLTAKPLCKILNLDYKKHKGYVDHIRSAWKTDQKNEQGLKCSVHAWRGWANMPQGAVVDRAAAETVGWLRTRARNRWLLFKDGLGRLQWFETGRVNIYVRKPATRGRLIQLLAKAFTWTGLIKDFQLFKQIYEGVRFKGAHYVFDTGERLPKVTIDLFGPSMGVVVKIGDLSHPTGVEILAHYPDWQEKNERLFQDLQLFFREFAETFKLKPPEKPGSIDYAV